MSQRYAFGAFLLDERERRLTRDGQVVHLQPKSFEVLLYLVERAGHLVTKNDILDSVWRDAVVTESSLTVCIRQVRIALDDPAASPLLYRNGAGRRLPLHLRRHLRRVQKRCS